MKKHLSLALALAMLLSTAALVACGEDSTDTTGGAGSSNAPASSSTPAATSNTPAASSDQGSGETTEPTTTTTDDKVDPPQSEEDIYRPYEEIENLAAYIEAGHINLMTDYYESWDNNLTLYKGFDWSDSEDPEQAELGNESAPNIFDGNTETKWCCGKGDVEYTSAIVWAMKEAVNVTAYSITTANDNVKFPERNPIQWRLYATNDLPSTRMDDTDPTTGDTYFNSETVPEGWVLLDAVLAIDESTWMDSLIPDENFYEAGIELPQAGKYQYFMLLFDWCEGNDVFQISEFTLYGTVG